MRIFETPRAMQAQIEQWRASNKTIGFVPTMGALHAGHLSLVQKARAENSKVVVSIFVNPTQFRAGEDLQKYPRPFKNDCALLEGENCDAVFAPHESAMYAGSTPVFVEVGNLTVRWEGAARPGHFRGVATIVAKLFNCVRAHRTYFGEKDFQQLKIIEAMAHTLFFETRIVPCPTVREADGLALSSRNIYLSPEERAAATAIYRALCGAQHLARESNYTVEKIESIMRSILEDEGILQTEYAAIVDEETLEPVSAINEEKPARAIIAARAGSTRLIDNIGILGK
jgi:pantoate--beta-alanine ligase